MYSIAWELTPDHAPEHDGELADAVVPDDWLDKFLPADGGDAGLTSAAAEIAAVAARVRLVREDDIDDDDVDDVDLSDLTDAGDVAGGASLGVGEGGAREPH